MHKLLLDFGHMLVTFHHFCVVVWRPLPRCAGCLKLAYGFLCCSKSLENTSFKLLVITSDLLVSSDQTFGENGFRYDTEMLVPWTDSMNQATHDAVMGRLSCSHLVVECQLPSKVVVYTVHRCGLCVSYDLGFHPRLLRSPADVFKFVMHSICVVYVLPLSFSSWGCFCFCQCDRCLLYDKSVGLSLSDRATPPATVTTDLFIHGTVLVLVVGAHGNTLRLVW